MKLPCGALNKILEPHSNNLWWAEVNDKTSMVSNPTFVWENVHIDTFDSGHSIHGVDWHDSIPGGMCMPVQPKHCSLKLRFACARHFAICPVYTFSLKSPSNMISESVIFHNTSWAINCSKNIDLADLKLPWASKYCSCCSQTIVPAKLELLEPKGWYAMTTRVFLSPEPTFIQHHWPRPWWSTLVSTTSVEKCPIAIIAHGVIALHSLIDIMCYYAPSVHSNAYYISKLLLLGCLVPICLHLATSQYISLKLRQSLFRALIFTPFVKNPRLLKFSFTTRTQLSGLVPGALLYAGLRQKSLTYRVIWFFVLDSCWAIWKAVSARWELLLHSRAVQFFFCINAISLVADGHDCLLKSLVPVSNCLDWALNRQVASDSDQQLPRQEWWSLAAVHLFRWLWWPLLLPDPSGSRSEIVGFKHNLKLVATCVGPPFFFLLLLYSDLALFVHSAGP